MSQSFGAIWSTLVNLVKDFSAMSAAAARSGVEVSADLVRRYASSLLWFFKVCCALWVVGIASLVIGGWSGNTWLVAGGLSLLLLACVLVSLSGFSRSLTWLMLAGRLAGSVVLAQLLLAAVGQHRSATIVAYVLLVGVPAVAFMAALTPIAMSVELVERVCPALFRQMVRRASIVVFGLLVVVVNGVILLGLPSSPEPLFLLVLAIPSTLLLGLIGLGLVKINPRWLFSKRMLGAVVAVKVVGVIALMMPDMTARVTRLTSDFNDRFIDPPTPVTFESSEKIKFADLKGRSVLWFAETSSGGFEFCYTKSKGLHREDGSAWELADTTAEKNRIRDWVDADAARRRVETEATARREAEARATQVAADAKEEEERIAAANDIKLALAKQAEDDRIAAETREAELARSQEEARVAAAKLAEEREKEEERARLASYLSVLPDSKVNYVLFCVDSSGKPVGQLASALSTHLSQRSSIRVAGGVFTDAFACSRGFDAVVAGKGAVDLASMRIGEVTDRLLLIRGSDERSGPSVTVVGAQTYSMRMTVSFIDAKNGRSVGEVVIADVSGAGVNGIAAKAEFFERFAKVLAARDELQLGL